jgi:putative endonuclease
MSPTRNVAVKIPPAGGVPRAPARKKLRMPPVHVQSWPVNLLSQIKAKICGAPKPEHLRRGELGERAAEKYLRQAGLKFLAANFRSEHGEIDLIFRDGDCLCFIEVKARSSETWTRPAAAVDARKKKLLSQTALDYLHLLKNPEVKFRFDIVEVLLRDGEVREVRHLPNVFPLARPHRYA